MEDDSLDIRRWLLPRLARQSRVVEPFDRLRNHPSETTQSS
jgi:hypothetical protein